MGPKKISDSTKPKRKAVRTTIELKKELIAKFESGTRISNLATQYGMAKSTLSSILKNKDIIKEANVAKGVTVLAVNRSPIIEQVEKLLLVWINKKQLAGDRISETIICEKAKQLHDDLKRDSPGTSAQSDEFKASRGWFDRFKKRSGIHSVVRRGEAASTNKDAAENFVGEFKNFVESEGFTPHQVQVDGDEREMEELQDPLETPMNVAATSTKPTSVSPKRNIDSNARRQRLLEKAEKCLDQELQDPLETPMNAAAASAKRTSVSPKRDLDRDTRRLRLLEKAEKFLDQEEDEYDGFGTYVTRKLRRLSETQRLSAEKEIMWKLLDLRSEEVVMNDEYLIELVRGYEELYDKNNRKYTDDYVKEGIWNSIGEELQKSGHECKSRWTSLIDQYQRYLKRCTARVVEEAASVPKWRYADEISFVRPYLHERDDFEYGSDVVPEHTEREDMLGATEQEQCESPGPTRHEVSSSKSCMKSKATVRSSKHVNPVGNDSENKEKHTDPIDLFFLSMAATVKKFTPYNRHICKTQVLSIVSGLELKELGTRAPFSTRSESRAQPRSPSPGNTSSCSSDAQYDMM